MHFVDTKFEPVTARGPFSIEKKSAGQLHKNLVVDCAGQMVALCPDDLIAEAVVKALNAYLLGAMIEEEED